VCDDLMTSSLAVSRVLAQTWTGSEFLSGCGWTSVFGRVSSSSLPPRTASMSFPIQ